MPTLKKRSGKTTITLYASEERQIQGAIETLRFIELNDGNEHVRKSCRSGINFLNTVLFAVGLKPPAETQRELIPDDVNREAEEAHAERTMPY